MGKCSSGDRRKKRKCLACNEMFIPDYRNRGKQQYCCKDECRRASKRASQRKWLSKASNADVFCGAANVERVRRWRAEHPGYWRGRPKRKRDAEGTLQDDCNLEPVDEKPFTENKPEQSSLALQDDCISQVPVLYGLIVQLTGSTLQDDIDSAVRGFDALGRDYLETVSRVNRLNPINNDGKDSLTHGAGSHRSAPFRMGGPTTVGPP